MEQTGYQQTNHTVREQLYFDSMLDNLSMWDYSDKDDVTKLIAPKNTLM